MYSDSIQKESNPVDHDAESNATQSKTQPNLPMGGQCLKMFKNIKNERVIVYFPFLNYLCIREGIDVDKIAHYAKSAERKTKFV